MSRWLVLGSFVGLVVVGCVLPDVEIDPSLEDGGVQVGTNPTIPGGGGSAGASMAGSAGASGGGRGGMGGSNGGSDDAGLGGAAGASMGGSGGAAGTAGSGGQAGASQAGSAGQAGQGGSDSAPELISSCDQMTDREAGCISYCTRYLMACEAHESNTYASETDCIETCVFSLWPMGSAAEPESICCRFTHAGFANTLGTNPHCFHSAEVPSQAGGCAPAP